MPGPVVVLGRVLEHAYSRLGGRHNNGSKGDGSSSGGYTRLPITITRTSSSTDSHDLGSGNGGTGWYAEDSIHFSWSNPSTWWSALPPIRSGSRSGSGSLGSDDYDKLSSTARGGDDDGSHSSGLYQHAWNSNKRSLYAWIASIIFGIIVISTAYKATTSDNISLVATALRTSCDADSSNAGAGSAAGSIGWFRHPTVYPTDGSKQAHRRHVNLRPQEFQLRTSQSCADLWVAKGELCQELQADDGSKDSVLGDSDLDVAWSFVEPSSYWKKWELAYKGESEGQEDEGTGPKHFRSYDEIRYSIRSVVQNLPFVKKMTLLATTLPASPPPAAADLPSTDLDAYSAQVGCRVAQTPDWIEKDSVKLTPHGNSNNISKLEILSQWEQFDAQSTDQEEVLAWKHSVLPTFNSHSIESQLYNLPSPSETVLYMNNDFYIGRPLTTSDLSTRIFGPVFKIYPHSWATGAETLEEAMAIDGEGNARVMPNTIRHLDNRFGRRDRNYPDHVGYVLSTSMMNEVAKTWGDELKETASVRFRGRGPEVWLPLLTMYYIIEKQREATLWSFIVARSDIDGDNTYSLFERQGMLSDLDGVRDGDLLHFRAPKRTWDDAAHKSIIKGAGITVPNETQLYWTAANGYPYVSGEEGNQVFPNYDGANENFCTVRISECFGRPGFFDDDEESSLTPEDLMKHVGFGNYKCGDCLIAALLSKSGPRGFEAFLPEQRAVTSRSDIDTREKVAMIGGWDKSWQNATYSLKNTLPKGWNRRDFAVRLVQRYTFAFGETPTAFNQLNNDPGWIDWFLWRWTEDRASFMALNDHVTTDNSTLQQQIREKVMKFQEKMWPVPTIYEQA